MAVFLGIDTSNYTTSVALYDSVQKVLVHRRKLLPVKDGSLGLRQSDAVFFHTRQIAPLMEELFLAYPDMKPVAIGVSTTPRDAGDSYMPCFLVGENVGRCLGAALNVPVFSFSHQAGHIMAALASIDRLDLAQNEFLAFHVSGGTTDLLHVKPHAEKIITISQLASSLDLKAGQAVDRVGVMLGLSFPAGKALDALSLRAEPCSFSYKPVLKNGSCCLSGIENICRKLLDQGEPAEKIALCCLDYIGKTLEAMTLYAREIHPALPVVYCGGVMSNTLLRERLGRCENSFFGQAAYSSDNACGTAVLASLAHTLK